MPTAKKKYPEIHAVLYAKTKYSQGPLSSDDCKKLIGWTEAPKDNDWGKDFTLKDLYGKKIRLLHNYSNRPFKRPLADRYTNEHLRGKWALNLETIVIDANGNVSQGQHRLVGFIIAEMTRQIEPKKWGTKPLTYETLVGFGVSPEPANANTYDLGAKRTLGDVIYRHQEFAETVSDKEQKKIATLLAGAVRLVWLRVGGQLVSFAPHFPHSEALEFYGKHPKVLNAVDRIVSLNDEQRISSLISPSYAAALLYLMARATSWEKAQEFWELFASGEGLAKGNAILTLRQLLMRMDTSSGSKRDELIGAVVKAWLLWTKNKKAHTTKDIKVNRKKENDRIVLSEFPRIGGLDKDVDKEIPLSRHQRLVLSLLRNGKEPDYAELKEASGLQGGTLAEAIIDETKQGKQYPHSLMSRGLVEANQYEDEDSYRFRLSAKGRKLVT